MATTNELQLYLSLQPLPTLCILARYNTF